MNGGGGALHCIRALADDETANWELAHLLWLATEADEGKLERTLHEVLPALTLIGVFDQDRLVAFAALEVDAEPTVIRYIAVDEGSQGRGHGSELVRAVDAAGPGRGVYAETDYDAVDFYRRVGFAVRAQARDPRWPERQRYACLLM